MYAGTRFRSKLEARWAALFDSLGWAWDYEPLELNGYIPDFVLRFYKPLLVEVKPAMSRSELTEHAAKIARSGWHGEALLVGACLFNTSEGPGYQEAAAIGLICDLVQPSPDVAPNMWNDATLHVCLKCQRNSIIDSLLSWHCRASGCYDGKNFVDPIAREAAEAEWREAGNKTQWLPREIK